MTDLSERHVLQWYRTDTDAGTPTRVGRVVEVPTVRSLALDKALDTLTDALVTYGREAGWIRSTFGSEEVDLLEAARLDIFQRLKVPFRSWWAWQLAAESGNGHAWKILCSHPDNADVVALADDGRALGLSVELEVSDEVAFDTSEVPEAMPFRLWSRISAAVKRRIRAAKPCIEPPDGRGAQRILYEDFYPNNTHCLIPLYRGLQNRASIDQLYASLRPKVDRVLESAGVPSYPLYRCPPLDRSGTTSWSPAHADCIRAFVYEWADERWPSPWLKPTDRLCGAVADAAVIGLQRAHRFACQFRTVLDSFRPTTVVVSTDFSIDARVLELLARQRGIRSISVQHGLFYEDVRPKYFLADVLCVWGAYHAEFLNELPDRETRVVITGSPKHDRLRRRAKDPPHRSRPLIVYASTPITVSPGLSRNDYVKTIGEVVRASRYLPNCDFVIKLHPSEQARFARKICARHGAGSNLRVTKDDDVYDLLEASCAVIVVSSTLGYEALLMERPVVILNLTEEPDWLPLCDDGAAHGVHNEGGLLPVLKNVIGGPTCRIDTTRYWHPKDGALERCLGIITAESANAVHTN